MISVKIDTREQTLWNKLQAFPPIDNVTLTSETLPIGDIILSSTAKDGIELVIIERKTVADLMASVKDGRYEEQSFRLTGQSTPNHHIIYLIEGRIPAAQQDWMHATMFSINYYKGFSLWQSASIDDTASIIRHMAKKLTREPERLPHYGFSKTDAPAVAVPADYSAVVKKVKKDNVTTENIGEIMLAQIPGVSATVAHAIIDVYGTLPGLISALHQDATCLEDFKITGTDGKLRRVNKTAIADIVKHLV